MRALGSLRGRRRGAGRAGSSWRAPAKRDVRAASRAMASHSEGMSVGDSPASRLARRPSADQSSAPPPPAISVEEAIGDQARHRHRHLQILRRAQGKLHVLVAELGLEAGRLIALLGDQRAIGLVDRRAEQRAVRRSTYCARSMPALPTSAIASPKRLDHRGDQEIAAELDEIGLRRLVRRRRRCAGRAHRTEAGSSRPPSGLPAATMNSFAGGSGVGPPEHRRRDELLALARDAPRRAARPAPR